MPPGRVQVIAASNEGFILVQEKARSQVPWSAVESVAAGMVPYLESDILVLAVGLDDGRVIMIGEVEPVWSTMTGLLAEYLPGLDPFEELASRLVIKSDPELLYERRRDRVLLH